MGELSESARRAETGNAPTAFKRASEAPGKGAASTTSEADDVRNRTPVWRQNLTASYDRIGVVLVKQGKLDDALNAFRDTLAIRERLAKADPANAARQADLAGSRHALGQFYVKTGDKAEALRLFTAARAIAAPLAETSGNKLWQGLVQSLDADIAALGEAKQ